MARDYLLPRYQSLVQATDKQEQSWAAFCRQPTADGFGAVRSAFQAAMDAWMPLQHVHTGPASLQTRIDRIYFWPERKNAVTKQVAALLQSGDAAALAPDRIATASVAVQGFPALQLLLYDGDDPAHSFLSGDPAAAYRCAYGTAVARNLKAIAGQIVEGWTAAIDAMAAAPAAIRQRIRPAGIAEGNGAADVHGPADPVPAGRRPQAGLAAGAVARQAQAEARRELAERPLAAQYRAQSRERARHVRHGPDQRFPIAHARGRRRRRPRRTDRRCFRRDSVIVGRDSHALWTPPSAIPAGDRRWRRCWPTSGACATWWGRSCPRRSAFPWDSMALDGD